MADIDEILIEYEKLRFNAARKRDEYVSEIYKKFPEIEKIENEINDCGIKSTGQIIKNPSKGEQILKEMEESIKLLKNKRAEILKKNGVSSDYNEIIYSCNICKDTGFTDNEKCGCLKKRLTEAAYEKSNMGQLIKNQSFESFNFDYYSREAKKGKISSYEYAKLAYDEALKFCDDFTESKNIMFYGNSGLGKTFISSCIAKRMIDNGKFVNYITATKIFSVYDDYKFNRGNEEENKSIIDDAYKCDLLIIDDLGTEFLTSNSISFFFDILNDRIINNRKIIISTNLSIEELKEKYTPRFISRLYESFITIKFEGENIRKKLGRS